MLRSSPTHRRGALTHAELNCPQNLAPQLPFYPPYDPVPPSLHLVNPQSQSQCSLLGKHSPRPSAAPSPCLLVRYATSEAPHLLLLEERLLRQWAAIGEQDANKLSRSHPRSPSSVLPVVSASRCRSSSSSTPGLASSPSTISA